MYFLIFFSIHEQTDELHCRTNISYERSCYNYTTYVGPSGSCDGGVKSPDDYCYFNDCYYHAYRTSCYKYRTYVGNSGYCPGGFTSAAGYCYSVKCLYHEYADICYRYSKYVNRSDNCAGVRSPDNYCYTACPDGMYTYLGSCYDTKPNWEYFCNGFISSEYHCHYTHCPLDVGDNSCHIFDRYVSNSETCKMHNGSCSQRHKCCCCECCV